MRNETEQVTAQRLAQNSIDIEDGTQDTSQVSSSNTKNSDVSQMMYFIGVFYVLCASTALSFQACWVKLGKAEGFKPFQMLLGRGIIQLFFTALIDVYDNYLCTTGKQTESPTNDTINDNHQKPENLSPQNAQEWMWVCLRGILGFFTAYGNYYAVTLLPLGMFKLIIIFIPVIFRLFLLLIICN